MPRTKNEIIADIEIWAKEKLAAGEEIIYLEKELPITNHKSRTTIQSSLPIEVHTEVIEAWKDATDLPMLKTMIEGCTKCELHKTRTKFVFGVGNPNAKVMVIGEAPGK